MRACLQVEVGLRAGRLGSSVGHDRAALLATTGQIPLTVDSRCGAVWAQGAGLRPGAGPPPLAACRCRLYEL